jgi:hypothetical protein
LQCVATSNFKTENNTYRKLIGNGLTYAVPPFQRDYSWEEEQWEDLWLDLLGTIATPEEPAHYLGYLVLQSADDKAFDVIDGQQRLTTLTLLVLAVLKHLQRLIDEGQSPDENGRRLEQLRRTYVGSLDPVSLKTRSKLTLNRNNDSYFQDKLVPLQKLPQRRLKQSEHRLRQAFEWFEKKILGYLKDQPGDLGKALAKLVEDMSDKLFFTVINVTDDLNAYRVFETLNSRGVRLSAADLLKNYLFSVIGNNKTHRDDDLPVLQARWQALVERLGNEDFPEFLRAHWLSTGRFVRHAELFKAVKKDVANRAAVFELLRGLDENLDRYLALREPAGSLLSPTAKDYAEKLKLFNVKQPHPLLMAAHRAFAPAEFEAVLRACMVVSFRYNVICGLSPGEQEPVFAESAKGINDGSLTNSASVIRSLSRIYPSDAMFEAAFEEKVFARGKTKLIRYILCELEHQKGLVPLDPRNDAISIEHVLPQSPGTGWEAFPDAEVESMAQRIGNMVLLRRNQNSELGNQGFLEKRPVLLGSEFVLTRELAEQNLEWDPSRLMGCQAQLAKLAGARWRLARL